MKVMKVIFNLNF